MSDLDQEETLLLRRRLTEAVPDSELFGPARFGPGGVGLAARARKTAQRTSRRRWATVAVAGALVAGAVVFPRLLGDEPLAADQPVVPPASCLAAGEIDHQDMSRGDAAWIRFCPTPAGETQVAPVLDEPVIDAAADVLNTWRASLKKGDVVPCAAGEVGLNYRVQIGFTDGTVGAASGLAGCPLLTKAGQAVAGSSAFGDLLTAQGRELADRYVGSAIPADAPGCPSDPQVMDTNRDGPSSELMDTPTEEPWQHAPIMPVAADAVAICRYEGRNLVAVTTDRGPGVENVRVAERIRVALQGHVSIGAKVDCGIPGNESYVVVLQDATGTRRTFSIGKCRQVTLSRGVPGVDEYYGLSENQLITVIVAGQ